MSHESFLATVAEDVKNLLAAHDGWSENVQPTREWLYYERLENQADRLRVAVVPFVLTFERADRGGQFKTATIDIIVQEKPAEYTQQRMDQLASLVEQLFAFFNDPPGRKLPNVNAQMSTEPTFPNETFIIQDSEQFYKQFASVVRTTWQALE